MKKLLLALAVVLVSCEGMLSSKRPIYEVICIDSVGDTVMTYKTLDNVLVHNRSSTRKETYTGVFRTLEGTSVCCVTKSGTIKVINAGYEEVNNGTVDFWRK